MTTTSDLDSGTLESPSCTLGSLDFVLSVSERFVSVQGEGTTMGQPAAFLRLGRCNLACSFCDTPYTWDFARYDEDVELSEVSARDLLEWIVASAPGRLIVTGGEPLIQHRRLGLLLARAKERVPLLVVEVETNGTIAPCPQLLALVDQWNVSPKLASSGEPEDRRIREAALEVFLQHRRAYFKFVIGCEADVAEVRELTQRLGIGRERVLFMPEARTKEELRQRSPEVAAWALGERVRFGSRLHLELFDGRRGT